MKNRLLALLICLIGFLMIANFGRSQAQSPNQVGLVVSYGDGQVWSGCVPISASSATGLDVLQNSGLNLTLNYSPIGAAVCKIGDVGCPADNCFCKSPPDSWNYWHLQGSGWSYSNLGASNATINSGAVEGWSWGQSGSAQPPLLTFDQICAAPAAPTATQVPPAEAKAPPDIPLPPTNTLAPSQTPPPTQTPVTNSSTPAIQAADFRETPSTTPSIVSTVPATPTEVATVQTKTATPGPKPTQTSVTRSPTPASRGTSDLSTWNAQNGYPIFAVLLIGMGIFLFVVSRRKVN